MGKVWFNDEKLSDVLEAKDKDLNGEYAWDQDYSDKQYMDAERLNKCYYFTLQEKYPFYPNIDIRNWCLNHAWASKSEYYTKAVSSQNHFLTCNWKKWELLKSKDVWSAVFSSVDCSNTDQIAKSYPFTYKITRFEPRRTSSSIKKETANTSSTVQSTLSSHQECLEARDYEGCMRVQSGRAFSSRSASTKSCPADEWCTATEGVDPLGRQKIVGWRMRFEPNARRVTYMYPSAKKVNVRGKTDRYFERQLLVREEKNAVAAIAPTTTSFGSAQTNCTGSGSTINCTTTPAPSFTSPGRAGRPGGVESWSSSVIYDCKDKTHTMYIDGRQAKKWKKAKAKQLWVFDEICPIINTLKTSSFDKYRNN